VSVRRAADGDRRGAAGPAQASASQTISSPGIIL
jgi:hypothetical protein